jgi:hypothetical protein
MTHLSLLSLNSVVLFTRFYLLKNAISVTDYHVEIIRIDEPFARIQTSFLNSDILSWHCKVSHEIMKK